MGCTSQWEILRAIYLPIRAITTTASLAETLHWLSFVRAFRQLQYMLCRQPHAGNPMQPGYGMFEDWIKHLPAVSLHAYVPSQTYNVKFNCLP